MSSEKEIWKDIKNYEGKYQISNTGMIRNNYGKLLKPFNKHGKKKYDPNNDYLKIHLYKNKRKNIFSVHRLVAEAFIPNPYNLPQINHKNGIKNDNNVDNLEWCTCKENIIHYHRILKKGEKNGSNK